MVKRKTPRPDLKKIWPIWTPDLADQNTAQFIAFLYGMGITDVPSYLRKLWWAILVCVVLGALTGFIQGGLTGLLLGAGLGMLAPAAILWLSITLMYVVIYVLVYLAVWVVIFYAIWWILGNVF